MLLYLFRSCVHTKALFLLFQVFAGLADGHGLRADGRARDPDARHPQPQVARAGRTGPAKLAARLCWCKINCATVRSDDIIASEFCISQIPQGYLPFPDDSHKDKNVSSVELPMYSFGVFGNPHPYGQQSHSSRKHSRDSAEEEGIPPIDIFDGMQLELRRAGGPATDTWAGWQSVANNISGNVLSRISVSTSSSFLSFVKLFSFLSFSFQFADRKISSSIVSHKSAVTSNSFLSVINFRHSLFCVATGFSFKLVLAGFDERVLLPEDVRCSCQIDRPQYKNVRGLRNVDAKISAEK